MEGKEREKTERLRFGRFFYRFPNGESGAGGLPLKPLMSYNTDMMACDLLATSRKDAGPAALTLTAHALPPQMCMTA
jgi:hypothetical protein